MKDTAALIGLVSGLSSIRSIALVVVFLMSRRCRQMAGNSGPNHHKQCFWLRLDQNFPVRGEPRSVSKRRWSLAGAPAYRYARLHI